jgi:hypothetical protein
MIWIRPPDRRQVFLQKRWNRYIEWLNNTIRIKKMDRETQNKLLEEFDAIAWKLSVEVPKYASRMREIVGQFRYHQFIEDKKEKQNE